MLDWFTVDALKLVWFTLLSSILDPLRTAVRTVLLVMVLLMPMELLTVESETLVRSRALRSTLLLLI